MLVAVRTSPLDPITLDRVTLCFADTDTPDATELDGERCWPGITSNIALNREGWNGDWQNNIFVPQGAVDIALEALRQADPLSPRYRWNGAPFEVLTGEAGSMDVLFNGLVTQAEIASPTLKLTARVYDEPFQGDALIEKYDGRTGLGGPEQLTDAPKPACFGYCRNIEPVTLSETDYIFQVHGYGPVEEIVMVFERAIEFGPSLGDHPTLEALLAATVPEGQWATCHAFGLFRLGAPPAGLITVDVKGDNTGGFHQTTSAVIRRICEIGDVDPLLIDDDSLDAFEAAVPYTINVYVTNQEAVISLCQRLALPCNAYCTFSWAGQLQVSRFGSMPAATMELNRQGECMPPVLDAAELPMAAPFFRLEMQYARSWRVHTDDEVMLLEDLPEPVPVSIWKRALTQPERPTVTQGLPDGWTTMKPTWRGLDQSLDPAGDVWDSDVVGVGPVWRSGAMRRGQDVVGEWDLPIIDDPNYTGFHLVTDNSDGFALAQTNAVKAKESFTYDLDGGENSPAMIVGSTAIGGPFRLSFTVPDGSKSFIAGLMNYDPAQYAGAGSLNIGDIFAGVYVANNSNAWVNGPSNAPLTGVFPFTEFSIDGGYFDERIQASKLTLPPNNSRYLITYGGELMDVFLNGEHLRTFHFDWDEWDTEGFWPIFAVLSGGGEIRDIEFEPLVPSRNSLVPMFYVAGSAGRFDPSRQRWEVKTAHPDPPESSSYVYAETIGNRGSGRVTFRVGMNGVEDFTTQYVGLYCHNFNVGLLGFQFAGDGHYEIDAGSGSIGTGTYSNGDEFSVEYANRMLRFFKNGVLIRRLSARSGMIVVGYFELSKGGYVEHFDFQPLYDDVAVRGGHAEELTAPSVFTDEDETIDAGFSSDFAELARLSSLSYNMPNWTDPLGGGQVITGQFRVGLAFNYRLTGGAPSIMPFRPNVVLQSSVNGGSSWNNLAIDIYTSNGDGSTGPDDYAKYTLFYGSTNWQGSGNIIYRALITGNGQNYEIGITNFAMYADWAY